jgi:hypothetical protein
MTFDRRTRLLGAAALCAIVLGGAAATSLAANPAAAGIISAITTVSCSVTGSNWCVSGNNSSSGIGVIGTSKTGTGLRGTSTSQYGLKATSVTGTAILAQTTSGSTAITASAANGDAVSGSATGSGIGVYGSSKNGYGAYGTTTSGAGYGVIGDAAGSGTGLYGFGESGIGVVGLSSTGTGVSGQTGGAGIAVRATAGTGIGVSATNASGNANPAVYARNTNGNGGDFNGSYIGIVGRSPTSGFPIVATDSNSNNLFYVDGKGNVSYHGGLFHFATVRGGAMVKSYSSNLTTPTVEDTGTTRLASGAAIVRLDPTFVASIDAASGYRVFVTPNGDTRGLFVATKAPTGFIVREAQGGRSNVTFDYRIVATAAGGYGQRMAVMSAGAVNSSEAPAVKSIAPPSTPKIEPVRPAAPPPAAE